MLNLLITLIVIWNIALLFKEARLATIDSLDCKALWLYLNYKKKSARVTGRYIFWSNNYGLVNYVQAFETAAQAEAYYNNVNKLNFDKLFSDVKSELKQDF